MTLDDQTVCVYIIPMPATNTAPTAAYFLAIAAEHAATAKADADYARDIYELAVQDSAYGLAGDRPEQTMEKALSFYARAAFHNEQAAAYKALAARAA